MRPLAGLRIPGASGVAAQVVRFLVLEEGYCVVGLVSASGVRPGFGCWPAHRSTQPEVTAAIKDGTLLSPTGGVPGPVLLFLCDRLPHEAEARQGTYWPCLLCSKLCPVEAWRATEKAAVGYRPAQ